jgi:EAL domain-containing protein (putative c-di-GMP-specific phosphodiesterase class I)
VTAESLGPQLRAALPPLRLHSVSLYDNEANILWLSEGALGPDEHNLVLEALAALSADHSQSWHENGLEDGRAAICLPVRAPKGDLVGLAMILADMKSVGDGVIERMMTPQVRTIMQRFAVLLRASAVRPGAPEDAVPVLELVPDAPAAAAPPVVQAVVSPAAAAPAPAPVAKAPAAAAPAPVRTAKPVAAAPAPVAKVSPPPAPAAPAPPESSLGADADVLPPQTVDDILEFEASDLPAVEVTSTVATLRPAAEAEDAADDPPIKLLDEPAQSPSAAPLVATPIAPKAAAAPKPATPPKPVAAPKPAAPKPAASKPVAARAAAAPKAPAEPPADAAIPVLSPAAPVAAAESTSGAAKAAPAAVAATAATSGSFAGSESAALLLELQPYAKLRAGGRSRRYEVMARTKRDSAAPDTQALQRLLEWLSANRGAWNLEPTSFTLNLSITTLEDERFPQNVSSALKKHGIAADNIGFEIAEALCTQRRAQVERFITLCDKIGCFVVIDDFSMDSAVLPLLRSKALRLVKIDPRLTSTALKDKLSQAMVVAIAQAVRVLGIHCSAKAVESQAALQWLTAIGCDFAQGPALSRPHSLEALGTQATPEAAK